MRGSKKLQQVGRYFCFKGDEVTSRPKMMTELHDGVEDALAKKDEQLRFKREVREVQKRGMGMGLFHLSTSSCSVQLLKQELHHFLPGFLHRTPCITPLCRYPTCQQLSHA